MSLISWMWSWTPVVPALHMVRQEIASRTAWATYRIPGQHSRTEPPKHTHTHREEEECDLDIFNAHSKVKEYAVRSYMQYHSQMWPSRKEQTTEIEISSSQVGAERKMNKWITREVQSRTIFCMKLQWEIHFFTYMSNPVKVQ